ncbi:MAG: hypothetical protein V4671_25530 [Armatimonadota bacterium]
MLTTPHRFCRQPGYSRQVHCHNFKHWKDANKGTWQDPLTGVVMLRPSFLDPKGAGHFRPLANWTFAQEAEKAKWEVVNRAKDYGGASSLASSPLFSYMIPEQTGTLKGMLTPSTPFPHVVDLRLVEDVTEAEQSDSIEVALESKEPIVADQGFIVHYNAITDAMHRKRNWFAVIWDNIMVHFSMDGTARAALYEERGVYSTAPKIFQEFEIASPGDLSGRDGYFVFLPIPGFGLRILHSHTPQSLPNLTSSARSAANRGVLIPLKTRQVDGFATVFNASKVWLSLNPYVPMVCGFQEIIYDTSRAASFMDATFDAGFKLDRLPDDVSAFVPATPLRSALLNATLRKVDDSGPWEPGTEIGTGDTQARVKVSMQTNNPRYTPFLLSYGCKWLPVTQMRATTPVDPDSLWHLEWTDDDLAHFEGACVVRMRGEAQRKLVERGDTTFLIEESDDEGQTWNIVNGGFAQIDGQVKGFMYGDGMMEYEATFKLVGMEGVFDEFSQIMENAFDGLTPAQSINLVVNTCGFPFMDELPEGINDPGLTLPQTPQGQNWRFATREGDKGDEVIKQMLLLAKRQYVEWRIRYDFAAQKWVLEKKPRDASETGTWTFSPFPDEENIADHVVPIENGNEVLSFSVTPPEFNVLQPFGLSTTGNDAERVPGSALVNVPSLNDPASPDYLGRFKNARPLIAPVADQKVINWMGRRIFDAAGHRRLRPSVVSRTYVRDLKPGAHVRLRSAVPGPDGRPKRINLFEQTIPGSNGEPVPVHLWLKRRTVVLEWNKGAGDLAPTISYTMDTVWDSEL